MFTILQDDQELTRTSFKTVLPTYISAVQGAMQQTRPCGGAVHSQLILTSREEFRIVPVNTHLLESIGWVDSTYMMGAGLLCPNHCH